MQTLINNRLVTSLKPSDKPFEIRDTQLKGLVLRVQPSGIMTYYVVYARGKRAKVGRADAITPVQAREIAKGLLAKAYQGDDLSAGKDKQEYTLRSFLDHLYEPWAETNIKTAKATVKRLKGSFKPLLDKRLDEINPLIVEKLRSKRLKDGCKPTTVNRELADLKSLLSKAVSWGILPANPIANVKRCKADLSPKVRFLSAEEEKCLRNRLMQRELELKEARERANQWRKERKYKLYPSIGPDQFADYLMPMVLLAMNTGLRRGELFKLKWIDVNLDQANLTVVGDEAKSGKTRHIPLNDEASSVLTQWKAQAKDLKGLVFPSEDGQPFDNVRKSWMSLLDKAKITDFRFHDLRHHFASWLTMTGVDLNTVRELLGHSDYKMTLRYAHLAPEHKMDAVQRLLLKKGKVDMADG